MELFRFHLVTHFEKCSIVVIGWLQGRVVHFLRHNLVFYRVACIYMLLTWHKNNDFSNLWLNLDFQLEKQDIYEKNNNIYTPNI
jgi:hypothetical protein